MRPSSWGPADPTLAAAVAAVGGLEASTAGQFGCAAVASGPDLSASVVTVLEPGGATIRLTVADSDRQIALTVPLAGDAALALGSALVSAGSLVRQQEAGGG